MTASLIDPADSLERQHEKLLKITAALMRRVEQVTDDSGAAYAQFQRAAMLEEEVRTRTRELERALDLLNESNAQLAEANAETEAARSNLANAIETVQEGFALFDPDERLVMCNSRFGLHMPDMRAALKPGDSFRNYVQMVSRSPYFALPDGETPEGWVKKRMARHRDDHVIFNARMIWDRWVQVSEHRTPDGGTVILQTDVTDIMRLERQERERMLDDQARIIRATLDHLNQGVCIFDARARLVGWNQRVGELLTLPATLLRIGVRFETLFERFRANISFTEGVTEDTIRAWVDAQGGRRPVSFEIMRGPANTLAVHAQEMPDKGFVVSFTDVSAERAAVRAVHEANQMLEARVAARTLELEDALAEAERANASKSRFVAAASHDLLQPLSAAKLYLASVEPGETDPETAVVLGKANRALMSVEKILEALLDISKLDSGRAAIHVSAVPVGRMLAQLAEELTPRARQKGLELVVVPTSAVVASDGTYLRRIVQNLISNAIRYTESGRVLVGLRHRRNSVRLEVWDTGPGIREEDQNAIFGEFRRLNATASASEGMGLGLAIVERACGLLSHPLELRSEVGRGTVFSVEMPLSEAKRPAARSDGPPAPGAARDIAGQIVLVIENDAEVLRALTVMLESWDVSVLAAQSPQEAQALLDEIDIAPDAMVADYRLDDGALGTGVLTALRDRFGPVPACVVSANRTPEVVRACAGLDLPLLHKPIEPARLAAFLAGTRAG